MDGPHLPWRPVTIDSRKTFFLSSILYDYSDYDILFEGPLRALFLKASCVCVYIHTLRVDEFVCLLLRESL